MSEMTSGDDVFEKCLATLTNLDVGESLCVIGALLVTAIQQYEPHERDTITDSFVSILYKRLSESEEFKQ